MKYNLDAVIDRKGTHCVKWEYASKSIKGAPRDVLPLWVADMDFPCAQPILDAMHARVDRQIFGYSTPYTEGYLSAVCNWFGSRYDWGISPDQILVTPGVVPALGVMVRAFTRAGEGVIVQQPVYYPFFSIIRNNGRNIVNNPLILNNGVYEIDFDDLEHKAADPAHTLMILCSPHNPVGRVWTEPELTRVADICRRHHVILVVDEIHCDLLRQGIEFIPMAKAAPSETVISCTAASKTFNLAGLQISNSIFQSQVMRSRCEVELRDKIGLFGANPLSIVATEAAYTQGHEWLDQVLAYIDTNLAFVSEFISVHMPKVEYCIPQGTYLAWLDLRQYDWPWETLKKALLTEAKVALDDGDMFGEEGRGFERINAACPRSILTDCLHRMAAVLQAEDRA
ncbi:MAG: MalY/PatB family protein [Desulfatiglandaceae bacterium]